MSGHLRLSAFLVAATVLLAACSGSTPTTAPTATPVPATPAATAVAATLGIGYPSDADAGDTPSVLAINRLNSAGWKITPTFFAAPEADFAAVSSGQIQIAIGSTSAALLAIQAGGKFHIIGTQEGVAWLVVGLTAINSCNDLAGKRWALHSPAGVTTGYANFWLKANCSTDAQAGITPIFIQGSDNREAALLANQIDATLLDSETFADLQAKAPGKFHAIADLAQDATLKTVSSSIISVNDAYWTQHPEVVVAYLKGMMKAYADAKADPTILDAAAASQNVGWSDIIRNGVSQELNTGAEDPSLAITSAGMQANIDFYVANSGVKAGLTVDQIANFDPLKQASGS